MDVIKAQIERIKQQLAGLTASQRMLVGTLVAVMVLTLLYWGRYAGSPEMVPVLDQTLSEDEIGRIDMALEAKGVPHTVVGGKVLVPTDRKMQVVADLMYEQAMPRNSQSAFVEMSGKMNPFTSNSEQQAWYNEANQVTLSDLIRRFPGVADARVIINAKNEMRIEGSIPPSATIFITTRGQDASKQLVTAAADGVAGAVSGLTPGRISVIVNGISHRVSDSSEGSFGMSDDLIELKKKSEARLEQKVRDTFSYIPALTVTVTVDVENRTVEDQSHTYDAATTVVKPLKEETRTEENNSTAPPSGDPGAGANTGASIGGATANTGGTTSTVEETKTENQILPSDHQTRTQTPAGKDTVQSATVRVPRSYFVGVYRLRNPDAKDPDEAALKPIIDAELITLREGVRKCIGLKSEEDLSLEPYSDVSPVLAMATTSTTPAQAMNTVTSHVKEIAVGILAVASLLMMMSIVRKSTPAPIVAAPISKESVVSMLLGDESIAGEAGASQATLDGMELDEDAIRSQQVLEQVSTMVKENPDAAASLVKRWLNRS